MAPENGGAGGDAADASSLSRLLGGTAEPQRKRSPRRSLAQLRPPSVGAHTRLRPAPREAASAPPVLAWLTGWKRSDRPRATGFRRHVQAPPRLAAQIARGATRLSCFACCTSISRSEVAAVQRAETAHSEAIAFIAAAASQLASASATIRSSVVSSGLSPLRATAKLSTRSRCAARRANGSDRRVRAHC